MRKASIILFIVATILLIVSVVLRTSESGPKFLGFGLAISALILASISSILNDYK